MYKLKIAARKRAILAACGSKGLAIDEDERHAIQMAVIGKASLTDMTLAELDKLLDHLNTRTGGAAHHHGKPADVAVDPQLQKIEALLADQQLPWAYLHKSRSGPSMCRRLTGQDRIEWASPEGKAAVIAALAKRQAKHGGRQR